MMPRLSRRQFVLGAGVTGAGLLAGYGPGSSLGVEAQSVRHIGYLTTNSPAEAAPNVEAVLQGLREYGWVEGHNLAIEYRYADSNDQNRLEALASELEGLRVEIILTDGPATPAAQRATTAVPIVYLAATLPLAQSHLFQIAPTTRTNNNVTGTLASPGPLAHRNLGLLLDAIPGLSRVAVLAPPREGLRTATSDFDLSTLLEMAWRWSLEIRLLELRDASDVGPAVQAAAAEQADAMLVVPSPLMFAAGPWLVALANQQRLPTMYYRREFVELGGLIAYGPSYYELFRRAGYFVDRVLRGAKPADLGIEIPRRFDFAVNMQTARELGITFPHEVALQITEIIE